MTVCADGCCRMDREQDRFLARPCDSYSFIPLLAAWCFLLGPDPGGVFFVVHAEMAAAFIRPIKPETGRGDASKVTRITGGMFARKA
jgi:hypothetical protein